MTRDMNSIIRSLCQTRFFSRASDEVLQKVAETVDLVRIVAGENLFNKGDLGNSMYVVQSGKVKVHDGEVLFNYLNSGDLFGEMAVLDEDVRSASITAVTDTILLCINKEQLHDLIQDKPDVSMAIIGSLCGSLRDRVQDITNDYWHIKALATELEIGRKIQSGFLPETLPALDGWELAGYFQAARECAGDFYDAFVVEKTRHIAFIIGDVADKGVGAALFMTLFRSLLRATTNSEKFINRQSNALGTSSELSPAELITRSISLTNNYIAQTHGSSSMFATVFFGLLDSESGELTYVNCGHESSMIFDGQGIREKLEPGGPVVGLFPNAKFKVKTARLEKGETLIGYTDGVTEAMNPDREQYGMERLSQYLTGNTQPAGALLSGLEADIRQFTAGASQSDDITMLVARRL